MKEPSAGLFAAILCGYIQAAQWIRWADFEIVQQASPPMWLIDLSLAKDSQAALDAVRESINLPVEIDEIALGLIAYKYFENRITFEEFLLEAGAHTDASYCSIDCEYFYEVHKKWKESETPDQFEAIAAAGIKEDLAESLNYAAQSYRQIAQIINPQR